MGLFDGLLNLGRRIVNDVTGNNTPAPQRPQQQPQRPAPLALGQTPVNQFTPLTIARNNPLPMAQPNQPPKPMVTPQTAKQAPPTYGQPIKIAIPTNTGMAIKNSGTGKPGTINPLISGPLQVAAQGAHTGEALGSSLAALQGSITHNPQATQHALAAVKSDLAPGRAFLNMQQATTNNPIHLVAPTVSAAAKVAPFVVGPEVAGASRIASTPLRLAVSGGASGAVNAASNAAQQKADTGKVNIGQVGQAGLQGAGMGLAGEAIHLGATKSTPDVSPVQIRDKQAPQPQKESATSPPPSPSNATPVNLAKPDTGVISKGQALSSNDIVTQLQSLVKRDEQGNLVPAVKPPDIPPEQVAQMREAGAAELSKDVNALPPAGKGNMQDLTDKQAKRIALAAKNNAEGEVMNLVQRHEVLQHAIKQGVAKGEDRAFIEAVEHPEEPDAIKALAPNGIKNPEAFANAVAEQRAFNDYVAQRSADTGTPLPYRQNYFHHNVDLGNPEDAARYEELTRVRGNLSQPGYTKQRVFNDVRELENAGFKLKYPKVVDAAKDYANQAANTLSRNAFVNTFADQAPGHITTIETQAGKVPVDNQGGRFITGRSHGLNNVFLSPALGKATKRFIEPTDFGKGFKALDAANQALKQSQLALGGFHDLNVTKRYLSQEIGSALTGEPRRLLNVVVNSAKQDAAFWSKNYFAGQLKHYRDNGLLDRVTHDGQLTLGKNLDVGALDKKVAIGPVDKGLSTAKSVALVPKHVNEFLHSFLFDRKIPLMKLQTMESELRREGIPLKGELTPEQHAKLIAISKQINNLYGGITDGFIAKTGVGKYVQRQLMLAPDFTGGNLNSVVNMFHGGAKGLAWRQNMSNFLTSVVLVGVAASLVRQPGQSAVQSSEQKFKKIFDPKSGEFLKPSFDLPFTDSKGRHLTAAMPGSPVEEAAKLRNPGHFLISRGSAGVGDVTKLATNQNYYGQPLIDPFSNPNPSTTDKVKATLESNLPIPAANAIQLSKGAQNATTTVLNIAGLRVSKDPTDPKVVADNNYFKALSNMTSQMNPNDRAAFQAFQPTSKDRNGNYVIKPTVFDTPEKAALLLAHPNVLTALTTMNQSLAKAGSAVDPFYTTLTPVQQQQFLEHQLVNKNNTQQLTVDTQRYASWLPQFEQARSVYYNSLPPGDPNRPKSPVQPPTQSANVQALFSQYDSLTDPKQRAQFFGAHPELSDYMSQEGDYINKLLSAQGLTPLKPYPTADPATASYVSTYMAATPAQRSALRTGNPTGYNNMQAYLQHVDEYEVAKNGALDQLQGQTPNQKLLKGINSLATYDMVKNPDGTFALKYGSVNPGATSYGSVAALPQAGAVSTGAGGSSSKKHHVRIRRQRTQRVRAPRKLYKKSIFLTREHNNGKQPIGITAKKIRVASIDA